VKSYFDIKGDGGSNVAAQVRAQEEQLGKRLADVTHIVAVMSGKGGVGKSSVTVNLAASLQDAGHNVGIVDADINGASIVQMTGVSRKPDVGAGGMKPAIARNGVQVMSIDLFLEEGDPVEWLSTTDKSAFAWRGMVEVGVIREMLADTDWDSPDIILIDLPPGTDKLPNLLDILPALTGAIVVTVPSRASQYIVRKSVLIARKYLGDRPIGLVENMATFICSSCETEHVLFPGGGNSDWISELGVHPLGSIPFDPDLSEVVDSGQSYIPFEANSTSVAAKPVPIAIPAIRHIAKELIQMISKSPIPDSTVGVMS
jgi:ATP-binding protein involved in chromosome partitioning